MNSFAVSGLLICITSLTMGIFVFLKNPKAKINKLWSAFTFVVAIWGIGALNIALAKDPGAALIWWRVAYYGVILIPVLFVHFVYTFLERKEKWPIVSAYLLGGFFLVLNLAGLLIKHVGWVFDSFYYLGRPPTVYYAVMTVLWFFAIIFSHVLLLRAYRKSSVIKKNQIKFFFFATAVGFIGGGTTFLPVFGIDIYPYGNFAVPLYPLLMTYAIVRYRLMDIQIAFKKTMIYSLSAGLLTGLFVILVINITNLFSTFTEVSSFKISIFAALVIAFLFDPLRNRIQKIVDIFFYKKSYDYYTTIRKASRNLALKFDLDRIYSFIGELILSTLSLKNIYLLYITPSGDYEVVYKKFRQEKNNRRNIVHAKEIKVAKNHDILNFFKSSDDILIKDELTILKGDIKKETIDNIKEELQPLNGEAVVPVFVDNKLTLLLILGEKMSGDMFSDEDINLLNTIAAQTAIAIKNARLYKDKIRSERLASIGMMSATFAHEIRNPLTSLKTFAQLIPEKYNDPEFRDKFSKIVLGEIERVNRLIEDLLDFSNDKKTPGVNIFDIKALLDELVDYVRDRLEIEKRNIMVEKEYDENVVQLSGNQSRLKHAFINIMNNGCQAMNGDGVLKIRISMSERYVDVAMTDTGEGIPAEDIERIFDPFVTTKEMGIGLGLAISKKIVEDHGGRIKVRSKLRKGTTFTVSLPVDRNNNGEMNDIKQRANMETA